MSLFNKCNFHSFKTFTQNLQESKQTSMQAYTVDLNQVRCHIKFNVDENGVVRDKLIVFTMACTE